MSTASNQDSSRAAAFEQWSQGGGRSDATWEITRSEAAFVLGELRGKIASLEEQLETARIALETDAPTKRDLFLTRYPATEAVDLDAGRKVCVYCGGSDHPAECGEPDPASSPLPAADPRLRSYVTGKKDSNQDSVQEGK